MTTSGVSGNNPVSHMNVMGGSPREGVKGVQYQCSPASGSETTKQFWSKFGAGKSKASAAAKSAEPKAPKTWGEKFRGAGKAAFKVVQFILGGFAIGAIAYIGGRIKGHREGKQANIGGSAVAGMRETRAKSLKADLVKAHKGVDQLVKDAKAGELGHQASYDVMGLRQAIVKELTNELDVLKSEQAEAKKQLAHNISAHSKAKGNAAGKAGAFWMETLGSWVANKCKGFKMPKPHMPQMFKKHPQQDKLQGKSKLTEDQQYERDISRFEGEGGPSRN